MIDKNTHTVIDDLFEYTPTRLAKLTGVDRRRIRALCASGEVQSHTTDGGHIRIFGRAWRLYVESATTAPKTIEVHCSEDREAHNRALFRGTKRP
ncbi:MAG: hypothetical protein GY851_36855 [bacterium]|nr:hypothetical protein [bacterium]